jgi:sugar/nucleoside kinase (ribokinase family)
LHVSSVFLQSGLIKGVGKLFQRAKTLGLTTSLDPQWDPTETWELNLETLLPYTDVFLPNAQEFKFLTKSPDIVSGLEKIKSFARVVVIKDGVQGGHLWDSKKLLTKPAFLNAEVADCIGAGDSFNAGFISEFLKGKRLEHCLEVGNVMGAINTLASGGTTAFENLEAIKKIARNRFSYSL